MEGGLLQHIVIHKIGKHPLSGYSLCKEIEQSTGHKPSYGSVYPLLEKFTKEGILTVEEQGRKKIYTLTSKGREVQHSMDAEREKLISNVISNMKGLGSLLGEDVTPMVLLFNRLKAGQAPLGPVTANMVAFRDTMILMTQDGRVERHKKEINTMLKTMLKQLERME